MCPVTCERQPISILMMPDATARFEVCFQQEFIFMIWDDLGNFKENLESGRKRACKRYLFELFDVTKLQRANVEPFCSNSAPVSRILLIGVGTAKKIRAPWKRMRKQRQCRKQHGWWGARANQERDRLHAKEDCSQIMSLTGFKSE